MFVRWRIPFHQLIASPFSLRGQASASNSLPMNELKFILSWNSLHATSHLGGWTLKFSVSISDPLHQKTSTENISSDFKHQISIVSSSQLLIILHSKHSEFEWSMAYLNYMVQSTINYIGARAGTRTACKDDWGEIGPATPPELNSSIMDRWGKARCASQRSGKNTPAMCSKV